MTRRLVDLIDDHKDEYWFSDIFKTDPLDIVLKGNRASDPTFRKAMRVAMAKILDGEWKSATEGKERRDIMGKRQKDLNLEDENMIYVSSFGAAIVARKRIDEPKPLICNSQGRER
ncbi:hypothetical protein BCON_0457g00040 [Botryotinia convoluta]|uniref:Uncharacterized protein n=1 Tax=Botryotinia convoluta TaxID=54673 RepID=A0A4Z1HBJ8_9HELO|nr:hypothetical protein BCON_0457g00040 [Botryotinia convoluta]